MSMLSAQVDELRDIADRLQDNFTFTGFGGTTNTDPMALEAATLMRQAADTIWELRNKCADLMDERLENAKLRERIELYEMGCEICKDEAQAENAKLRELVRTSRHLLHEWLFKRGEVPYDELDAAYESMRELGIEVDE